ncbi:MAG: hypothetical protein IKL27_06570 [Oscillospiraceae bacterium]|nr:hypothetical protein [Oscillospiraceae bacterium]
MLKWKEYRALRKLRKGDGKLTGDTAPYLMEKNYILVSKPTSHEERTEEGHLHLYISYDLYRLTEAGEDALREFEEARKKRRISVFCALISVVPISFFLNKC